MTLFSKCFSSFDHSTCALSVSSRYLALEGVYLPLEQHSQTTRLVEGASHGPRRPARRGSHPLRRPVPGNSAAAATQRHPLQITTRTPKEPDFKFELLPLHSPLLGQSLLVSFPPLIDMLKFSGYSYLIRGQPCRAGRTCWGFRGRWPLRLRCEEKLLRKESPPRTATGFGGPRGVDPQRRATGARGLKRRSDRHAPQDTEGRHVRSKIR